MLGFPKLKLLKLNNKKDSTGLVLSFACLLVLLLPLIFILIKLDLSHDLNWDHFKAFILADALKNTLWIAIGTLIASSVIGISLATLVTYFEFPFRNTLRWLLYLPLAIPPYIAAYVLTGMLSYTGHLQSTLRNLGLVVSQGWFDIMNPYGAMAIYTITLYPYIYGALSSFLANHSRTYVETARTLGYRPHKILFNVIMPLIRLPLIGSGLLLLMEVLSDYGVVQYFNIPTLSAIIFRSWFGLGTPSVALRLSFYVLVVIVAMLLLEDFQRGRRRYHLPKSQSGSPLTYPLKPLLGNIASGGLIAFLLLIFGIPILQMLQWALWSYQKVQWTSLLGSISNTIIFGLLATALILLLALGLNHWLRWQNSQSQAWFKRITQLGYSMPGAIIGIGTISVFVALDNGLLPLYQWLFPGTSALLLTMSPAILVYAYIVRYYAVGQSSIQAGFSRLGLRYNDSARVLGYTKLQGLISIELPLLKNALATGFILTFIDIVKELPLTLLLRPFNYNSLATLTYQYANDERIHEASHPALIIVFVSLIAISLFMSIKQKGDH